MLTIKRYSNRKLYDTQAGRYITLEEIGEAVRLGKDLRVVDHDSGADLTAQTLIQIVLDEERKTRGWLPHDLLARLLRAGESRLGTLKELLAPPIDSREVVDRAIRRRVELLTAQGCLTQDEASRWLELLLDPALSAEEEALPAESQPATSAEIQALLADIERLEAALDEILSLPPGAVSADPASVR
jgi:polyhydroxyalkanoate synthesis repressor PhaR